MPSAVRMRAFSAVMVSLALTACAGGPRQFTPVLAQPAADEVAFAAALDRCKTRVDAARRGATVAGGAAAAVGSASTTYVVGGVAFAGGASATGTLAGAAAAAGPAMVIALPVSFYFFSRADRSRKERMIQQAMTGCMAEQGYRIVDWRRTADEGAGN